MALDDERKMITVLIIAGIIGIAFSLPVPEAHHHHHYKERFHYRSKYGGYHPQQPLIVQDQPLYGGFGSGHGGGVASAAAASASVSIGGASAAASSASSGGYGGYGK